MTALLVPLAIAVTMPWLALLAVRHQHDRAAAACLFLEIWALWDVGRFVLNAVGG